MKYLIFLALFCLVPLYSHAATTVWSCGTPAVGVAWPTTAPVTVSAIAAASSSGPCQTIAATPSSWYVRAIVPPATAYAWVQISTLAKAPQTFSVPISWTSSPTDQGEQPANLTANKLYRGVKADGSDAVVYKTLSPPVQSFLDSGLTAGTWCYSVADVNAIGDSPRTGTGCATFVNTPPPQSLPKTPTNLSVTPP